jgi:integrase
MALYKRGSTWHTDFSVNGERFRQSLDTSDWREAQSKEKELITQATQGRLTPKTHLFARLGFSAAADRHLKDREGTLSEKSIVTEKERLKPLRKYFGEIPLTRITVEFVRSYISERKKAGVANKTVNLEVGILRGVLKRAKRHNVGRALTSDEKRLLARIASSRPDWEKARLAMILALNTTMRSCEIKGLCWRDVNLLERTITIRRSNTDAGHRVILLNSAAFDAIATLYHRSNGSKNEPQHHVFPACENGKINPTKPQSSWRSAWRSLTRAIECPKCGRLQAPAKVCCNSECDTDIQKIKSPLAGLRFHDLRHHAITELAESQASDSTIMAIAGHVSREMLEHYSHVRLEAKRQAVETLCSREVDRGGYVTNNVTNGQCFDGRKDVISTKDWSGREDLNLRPPGPETTTDLLTC